MRHVKVTKTEDYKDSQGEHIVTKGKMVLIRNTNVFPEIGMLGSNKVHPLFLWSQAHTNSIKVLPEYQSTDLIQPIIISETETISEGDIILCNEAHDIQDGTIQTVDKIKEGWIFTKESPSIGYNPDFCRKIIVSSNEFSTKHLQAIIDNRLIDGENLLVEIEEKFATVKDDTGWVYKGIRLPIKKSIFLKEYPFSYGKQYELSLEETNFPNSHGSCSYTLIFEKDLIVERTIKYVNDKVKLFPVKKEDNLFTEEEVEKLLQLQREACAKAYNNNSTSTVKWIGNSIKNTNINVSKSLKSLIN